MSHDENLFTRENLYFSLPGAKTMMMVFRMRYSHTYGTCRSSYAVCPFTDNLCAVFMPVKDASHICDAASAHFGSAEKRWS